MKKYTLIILRIFIIFSGIVFFSASAKCERYIHYQLTSKTLFHPDEDVTIDIDIPYSSGPENELFSFTITLYKVTDPESYFVSANELTVNDVIGADSTNLLYNCTPIYSEVKEFQPWDTEKRKVINLYKRSKGVYIAKVSNGFRVAYTGFIVSSINVISKISGSSVLAYTAEKNSGKPVENAEVSIYYDKKKFAGGLSQNGVFFYTYSANIDTSEKNYHYKKIFTMSKSGDDFIVSSTQTFFKHLYKKLSAYIYTNQSAYRTNSEVYFKGIINSEEFNSLKPFAGQTVTCIIKDPNNAEVYKQVLKTNLTGSISGNIFVAKDAPLGTYKIELYTGSNNFYTEYFIIEQYKKPEYKVSIEIDKERYGGNDRIKGVIKADYFWGNPVSEGEVTYSIYRAAHFRPWWLFSKYDGGMKIFSAQQENMPIIIRMKKSSKAKEYLMMKVNLSLNIN